MARVNCPFCGKRSDLRVRADAVVERDEEQPDAAATFTINLTAVGLAAGCEHLEPVERQFNVQRLRSLVHSNGSHVAGDSPEPE